MLLHTAPHIRSQGSKLSVHRETKRITAFSILPSASNTWLIYIFIYLKTLPGKIPDFWSNFSSFLNTCTIKIKAVSHFTALQPWSSTFFKMLSPWSPKHAAFWDLSHYHFSKLASGLVWGGLICLYVPCWSAEGYNKHRCTLLILQLLSGFIWKTVESLKWVKTVVFLFIKLLLIHA